MSILLAQHLNKLQIIKQFSATTMVTVTNNSTTHISDDEHFLNKMKRIWPRKPAEGATPPQSSRRHHEAGNGQADGGRSARYTKGGSLDSRYTRGGAGPGYPIHFLAPVPGHPWHDLSQQQQQQQQRIPHTIKGTSTVLHYCSRFLRKTLVARTYKWQS